MPEKCILLKPMQATSPHSPLKWAPGARRSEWTFSSIPYPFLENASIANKTTTFVLKASRTKAKRKKSELFSYQTLAHVKFCRTFAPWFIYNSIGFRFNKTREPRWEAGFFFYIKLKVECPKFPKRQSDRIAKGFSEAPPKARTILFLSLYKNRKYALIRTQEVTPNKQMR